MPRPNKLTVRRRPKGGSLRPRVRPHGSRSDLKAPRLLIFVHGFNNSQAEASKTYRSMVKLLRGNVPTGGMARLGAIWDFYWPGDQAARPLPIALIKGYKDSLDHVDEVGRMLAEFLAAQPRRQYVSIVAHSMGCRVALEVLRRARDSPSPDGYSGARIRGIFLLAAAVPVRQCRIGASASLYSTALRGSAERVFYSHSDWVLRCAFPLGQPLRREERGPAVGLTGSPKPRWRSVQATGLGHGDYWHDPRVATEIATGLGARVIRTEPLEPLPEARLAKLSVSARKLAQLALPTRLP